MEGVTLSTVASFWQMWRKRRECCRLGALFRMADLGVTASVAFGQTYVAPIVNEFLALHPETTVEFLLVNRIVNLVEEGFDAAIRIAHLDDSSLISIPLAQVRRVVCASPAYLRRHGVPQRPEDLRAHQCVRFTGLAPHAEWPFRMNSRRIGVPVSNVLVCNEAAVAIDSCARGLGFGSFLSYMVASYRKSGRLKYVLEDFEIEPLPVQFIYPRSRIRQPRSARLRSCASKSLRT